MIKNRILVTAVMAMLILMLAGCGSVMNQTSSPVVGNSAVSGTVLVSAADASKVNAGLSGQSLSVSSLASINPAYIPKMSAMSEASGGRIKAFKIGTSGVPEYITYATVSANGAFSFDGLIPGAYILLYVKYGEDAEGKHWKLEEKGFAYVEDDGSVSINITPLTGAGAEYLVQEIFEAAKGGVLTKAFADAIYEKAITVYGKALTDGDIAKDNNVNPVDSGAEAGENNVYSNYYNDESLSAIANDDGVLRETKKVKLDIRSKKDKHNLTPEEAKQLIREVFNITAADSSERGRSQTSNSPPEFFIEKFADAYKKDTHVTIKKFAEAYHAAVTSASIKENYFTAAAIENMFIKIINEGKIHDLYVSYDNATDDISIPVAAKVVFPSSPTANRLINVNANQSLNVPQAILLLTLSGLIDGSCPLLPSDVKTALGKNGPPFDPFTFCQEIKFMDLQAQTVYITEQEIRPVKTMKQEGQNWQPVDSLETRVSVYLKEFTGSISKVEVTYPKANNQYGTYPLTKESGQNGGGSKSSIESSSMQTRAMKTASLISAYNKDLKKVDNNPSSEQQVWVASPWSNNGSTPNYVTDFVAGWATIKVYTSKGVVEARQYIIQAELGSINWEYPKGPNMETISKQGYDDEFTPQAIDVDNVTDKAKITVKWSTPTGDIPSGYELAYSVNLGLNYSRNDWNVAATFPGEEKDYDYVNKNSDTNRWKMIWSSWEDNRFIKGNSFKIKQELSRTTKDLVNKYETTYEINVTPLLIRKADNRVVWQGTDSRTQFKVGASTPWTVELKGTVTFPESLTKNVRRDMSGNEIPGTWKVGLFLSGEMVNGQWKNYLFDDNAAPREPLTITVNGTPTAMVCSLGTTKNIVDSHYDVSYSLPSFTKADGVIAKMKNYQLVVWYDHSTTGNIGAIDFYKAQNSGYAYSLEQMEMDNGCIMMDMSGVKYNSWNQNNRTNTYKVLSSGVSDQTIDIEVGKYWAK